MRHTATLTLHYFSLYKIEYIRYTVDLLAFYIINNIFIMYLC